MENLEPLQHLKYVGDKDETYLKIHSTMSVLVKAGYKLKKQIKDDYETDKNHFTIIYETVSAPEIHSDYIFMDFTLLDVKQKENYMVTILIMGTPGGKVTTYLSEKAEIEID